MTKIKFMKSNIVLGLTAHFLLQRGYSSGLLAEAFYASFFHQIRQNLHENDHLTLDYTPV
jgi:hypothetical protein